MKNVFRTSVLLPGVAMVAMLVGLGVEMESCNNRAQREDGLPELPKFLMHKAMGDTYYVDTLYTEGDNSYCLLRNPDYGQCILFDNDHIYAENAQLDFVPDSGAVYEMTLLLRSAKVNFADKASIQTAVDSVCPEYQGYKQFQKGYDIEHPVKAVYGITVDLPETENHKLELWLAREMGDTISIDTGMADFKEIGKRNAAAFFEELEAPSQMELYAGDSYTVYYSCPDYVTYLGYTYYFTGGAHGMYGLYLTTYDLKKNEGVDRENLFKEGSEEQLRELLYEGLLEDSSFTDTHDVKSTADVKASLAQMGVDELPIPQPALLPNGVAFCFQPYEIGPYSDGAYQLLIPYSKINQLMNDQ